MPARVANPSSRRPAPAASKADARPRPRAVTEQQTQSPVIDEGPPTVLRDHVQAVFADAQKSNTGHRKLVINLRKIQEACCYESTPGNKSHNLYQDFDEDDFNHELVRCVLRVLVVKKSETVGDRIVNFLGLFLKVARDKDIEIADQSDFADTPTSRLVTVIFKVLLKLFLAKDKTVRFRATQITAHIFSTLDTVDVAICDRLRLAWLKRIHDKEAPVRIHAIYGLTRILAAEIDDTDHQQNAEDSDDEDSSARLHHVLLDALQNDPSADVRRALLLNFPLTKDTLPQTLPHLLERDRDLDAATRRAFYARFLPSLNDFRRLSLHQREKLLRSGLRDRDETVRKATARLFREKWIDNCAASDDNANESAVPAPPSLDALLELLERIDVTNSGITNGVALDAMREFWQGRPDYSNYVTFDTEAFWQHPTPESVFVARTFNDYCRQSEDAKNDRSLVDKLEMKMPEVTKFAFLLEIQINRLIGCVLEAAAADGDEDKDEESVHQEFIVEQMLHMAMSFDYGDEVGRRKMLSLMREALALPALPEESTKLAVEVLRLVCGDDAKGKGESEFCGMVLEAIAEVHDTIMGDDIETSKSEDGEDSFHSARSELSEGASRRPKRTDPDDDVDMVDEEKAIREIMINMKCLHIAQCMLQNVQCDLEQNMHLVTMLNHLVVPAVRSQEAPIRERGLVCLGLCCLLGKVGYAPSQWTTDHQLMTSQNLAQENLALFLHCFHKGHAALQMISIQIITDILTTHSSLIAPVPSAEDPDQTSLTTAGTEASQTLKTVIKMFGKSLKSADPEVQATGANALAKLMLSQLITDTTLLKQLVMCFYDPETISNKHLRQALSYFLPVYCHSRAANAERMASVATGVIARFTTLREAFLDDENSKEGDEIVTLATAGELLVDWTDPRKIVGNDKVPGRNAKGEDGSSHAGDMTHFVLAEQILERLVTSQTNSKFTPRYSPIARV